MRTVDVAIVGGGVVGSATAYYLRKHGFTGSLAIIEKDTSYAFSCTARAVGGIRQQFSCPENILLSQFGLRADPQPQAGVWRRTPMSPSASRVSEPRHARGRGSARRERRAAKEHGRRCRDHDRLRACTRFPWLACDDIAGGALRPLGRRLARSALADEPVAQGCAATGCRDRER